MKKIILLGFALLVLLAGCDKDGIRGAAGKYKGTIYTSSWVMGGSVNFDTTAGRVEAEKDGEQLRIIADGIDMKVSSDESTEEGILLFGIPATPSSVFKVRVNLKTDSLDVYKSEGGQGGRSTWQFKGVK